LQHRKAQITRTKTDYCVMMTAFGADVHPFTRPFTITKYIMLCMIEHNCRE